MLSENEGANFWLRVLADLNNRGVKDILIASVDGLKGFPEAINAIFPKTEDNSVLSIRSVIRYAMWLRRIKRSSLGISSWSIMPFQKKWQSWNWIGLKRSGVQSTPSSSSPGGTSGTTSPITSNILPIALLACGTFDISEY